MSDLVPPPGAPAWTLADRMSKALKHAHVSVAEMAEYLGVSTATLHNWTSGKIRPKTQTLRLWALRCGVDYAWLTTGWISGTPFSTPEEATEAMARGAQYRRALGLPMDDYTDVLECGGSIEWYGTEAGRTWLAAHAPNSPLMTTDAAVLSQIASEIPTPRMEMPPAEVEGIAGRSRRDLNPRPSPWKVAASAAGTDFWSIAVTGEPPARAKCTNMIDFPCVTAPASHSDAA